MSNIKILKPKVPGVSLRDPKTRQWLPEEGKAVVMDTFWERRIEDGSVVEVALSSSDAPAVQQVVEPAVSDAAETEVQRSKE